METKFGVDDNVRGLAKLKKFQTSKKKLDRAHNICSSVTETVVLVKMLLLVVKTTIVASIIRTNIYKATFFLSDTHHSFN